MRNITGLCVYGAATKSRTRDLLITSQLLYQLSYCGNAVHSIKALEITQVEKTFYFKKYPTESFLSRAGF